MVFKVDDSHVQDEVQIDFTPLYQCIHIHDVLGKRAQLKVEFEENRRLQADLVIKSTFSVKNGNILEFQRYIQNVAGFFVVEATLMSATQDFRSRSSVESLWEIATGKMGLHMFESLKECNNPNIFIEMKSSINVFISTMGMYGFAVAPLKDFMLSVLDSFGELKRRIHCETIQKVIQLNAGS